MSYNDYFTTQWNRAEKEAYKAGIRKGEKNMTSTQEERLISSIDQLTAEVKRATNLREERLNTAVGTPIVKTPGPKGQYANGHNSISQGPMTKSMGPIPAAEVVKGLVKEIQKIIGLPVDGILGSVELNRLARMGVAIRRTYK